MSKTREASFIIIQNTLFPNMVVSFFAETKDDISKINKIAKTDAKELIVTSFKNPDSKDINKICVLGSIKQIITMPDDSLKVTITTKQRIKIKTLKKEVATYENLEDTKLYSKEHQEELKQELLNQVNLFINKTKKFSNSLYLSLSKLETLDDLIHAVISNLNIQNIEKQKIIESLDLLERCASVGAILEIESSLLEVEKQIRDNVKSQMEKNQKDYYLNEQMRAIQKELNRGEEVKDEIKELKEKINKVKLSQEAKEKVEAEIIKLSLMNPVSAEASVVRNYVDWVLSLPWKSYAKDNINLKTAQKYLNEEHYALSKIKERILEYLAVLKRSKSIKSPILCFVGPPGVGKTSLAKSIAKAAGREFVRISLGGVKDEAEIRGHRRTYIGAMPGKIIQAMKKSKTSNPLILLDEIDKMSSDFRGDPSSALLEVLDKEQNSSFVDHYIEVGYDISDVMFITTANSLNIQEALVDRMEVIELTGYSEEEKLEIAKKHLVGRKMKESALQESEFSISDKAIIELIRGYTKESGVRNLERVIGEVTRKVIKKLIDSDVKSVQVTEKNISSYAGIYKYSKPDVEKQAQVGITTGLAWTRVGGEILYIEAVKFQGTGNTKITGKIGDVMQESVNAAQSLLHANSSKYDIKEEVFKEHDVHLHVPEGATPKDGPSAGAAMFVTLYSLYKNLPVRADFAMTGEITLRGKILPIGGVREKLLAALRSGITNVIIPKDNHKDLEDLPAKALKQLKIHAVTHIDEVLDLVIKKNEIIKNTKSSAKKRNLLDESQSNNIA